jgi:hypothetical protein
MFHSLALGGGGVRGGLHIGALAAYEKICGPLVFPNGIYGCSIGSIVATAVAFHLTSSQIYTMFETHFHLDRFLPAIRLSSIASLSVKKGLFPMEKFETALLEAFASQNVDLRGKTIADAPQRLCIVASNMTTQNVNIFAGTVPILDAIKCSSCLPLVFAPQILYNQVYLDGGIFVDCLSEIVPPGTLVFHISAPSEPIFPSDLDTMELPTYFHRVYRSMRGKPHNLDTVWLQNTTISMLQTLTPEDKKLLHEEGFSQASTFLSKRLAQKLH